MTRYLLDTNILSNVTKPAPSPSLLAWMAEQPDESLFISSLTIAEIRRRILEAPRAQPRRAPGVVRGPGGASGPLRRAHPAFRREHCSRLGESHGRQLRRRAAPATPSTPSSQRPLRPTTVSRSPTTRRISWTWRSSTRFETRRHEGASAPEFQLAPSSDRALTGDRKPASECTLALGACNRDPGNQSVARL